MEYLVKEVLKKEKKSTTRIILSGFIAIIILNILITLTNNLGKIQNVVCIMLLVVFGIIIFFIVERVFSTYIYLLGEDTIGFAKAFGKKESIIIKVNIDSIKFIKKIEELEPNPEVYNTYYFIYRDALEDCYFCEYTKNKKLYRFVFNPSERLVRILERKINRGR